MDEKEKMQLRSWSGVAERPVFSRDDRHWSNSIALWMSLNALDATITWLCLSLGMSEANQFLSIAAQTYGEGFMLITKMSLALLLGILVWRRGIRRMKGGLNLFMALIVILNCLLVWRPLWSLTYIG